MDPSVPATIHLLTIQKNPKHASYFVMNECISLKFLYKSKTQYCSHKKKRNQQNIFLLKCFENCLKSDSKYKIQKSVRNIPRNNVIKDNVTIFLKIVKGTLIQI